MAQLSLTVLRCPDYGSAEQRLVRGVELTIGRGTECDWPLPDPLRSLSRKHCRLEQVGAGWQVVDLSANGTFVNFDSQAIGRDQAQPLRDGDRLRLGDYELEVRLAQDSVPLGGSPFDPGVTVGAGAGLGVGFGAGAALPGDRGAAPPSGLFGEAGLQGEPGITPISGGFGAARLPGLDDPVPSDAPGSGLDLDISGGLGSFTPAPAYGAQDDHAPSTGDAYRPPAVLPEGAGPGAAAAGGQAIVPDDWLQSLSLGASTPAPSLPLFDAPAPSPSARPPAPLPEAAPGAAELASDPWQGFPPAAEIKGPGSPFDDLMSDVGQPPPPAVGPVADPLADPLGQPWAKPLQNASRAVPGEASVDPSLAPSPGPLADLPNAPSNDPSADPFAGAFADPVRGPATAPPADPWTPDALASTQPGARVPSSALPFSAADMASHEAVDLPLTGAPVAAVARPPAPAPTTRPPPPPVLPVPAVPPKATSAAAPAGESSLAAFAALLAGGGLPVDAVPRATHDPEAALRHAGALMQVAVAGLRALLVARGLVKREFRIEQTMLRPKENNPLKFAASDEHALASLLDPRMGGLKAVQDAVDDLSSHEVAVLAATQAAAHALLEKLSPEALEAEDPGGSGLFGASAEKRLWLAYKRRHATLMAQLEDDFDSAFGIAFARAYERAVGQRKG